MQLLLTININILTALIQQIACMSKPCIYVVLTFTLNYLIFYI